ncbi:MAG TPA: glycosyltransferase family 39 protein [Flavipsychrobacter sp.]|nr:glycosyltransferase family 39 protein [Flavipsychrobacter sp.]
MRKLTTSYTLGLILFIFSLFIGILCFKDYGMSWDEHSQRELGLVSYNYMFNGDSTLKTYEDRDHGSSFETPLILTEKLFHLTDERDIFFARHLVTHIFFLISAFCGYILALRLFKSQWIASIGFIILVFNPRLYAHSFFNPKDIPFLSAFLISMLVAQIAFEKNKPGWFILLGIVCGFTSGIRIMGILLPCCLCGFLMIDIVIAITKKEKLLPIISNFSLLLISFVLAICAFWTTLWNDPFNSFATEFSNFARYVRWDGIVLLNGKYLHAFNLPWYYAPEWFSITTPALWLFLGLAGIIYVIIAFIKNPISYLGNTTQRNFLLYLACFALPFGSVIFLHSVIYDDWRHLYFVYPSFVMLALFVLHKLSKSNIKLIVSLLCLIQIGSTGFFMIKYHPFEQIFFNRLVSHKDEYLRKNFELDYWGCSYMQGLDSILAHDSSTAIRVALTISPVVNNTDMLHPQDRKRVVFVWPNQNPDYFLTNFRYHPGDYDSIKELYAIKVLNSTIMGVYKLH